MFGRAGETVARAQSRRHRQPDRARAPTAQVIGFDCGPGQRADGPLVRSAIAAEPFDADGALGRAGARDRPPARRACSPSRTSRCRRRRAPAATCSTRAGSTPPRHGDARAGCAPEDVQATLAAAHRRSRRRRRAAVTPPARQRAAGLRRRRIQRRPDGAARPAHCAPMTVVAERRARLARRPGRGDWRSPGSRTPSSSGSQATCRPSPAPPARASWVRSTRAERQTRTCGAAAATPRKPPEGGFRRRRA